MAPCRLPAARATWVTWLAVLAAHSAASSVAPQLRFQDGVFKLVMLTDLHYGQGGPQADLQTHQVQEVVLDAEQPDMVVLSGDMVSGFEDTGRRGWYEARWQHLTRPANERGIPYASILGNHDAEGSLSRRAILDLDMRSSNLSLTRQGPEGLAGASNYWIDVLDEQGQAAAARIWMLDSQSRGCGSVWRGWGCVGADTVAWLERTAAALPPVATSLAFIHIPIPQFMDAWRVGPTNGSRGEDTACPLVDTGVFQALKAAGVQAVWSGHDHDNDWVGTFERVRLGYGRKSGYGNYGPPPGWAHGARVIQLRQGESAAACETWMRNELGEREDQGPTPAEAKAGAQQATCASDGQLLEALRVTAATASRWAPFVVGIGLLVLAAALLRLHQSGEGGCLRRLGSGRARAGKGWAAVATAEEGEQVQLCRVGEDKERVPLGAAVVASDAAVGGERC